MRSINKNLMDKFKNHLFNEEKSSATIEKYLRDIRVFSVWLSDARITKNAVLEYKKYLIENYAPASVNSMISSLNSFFGFCEWNDCRVKTLKIQRRLFTSSDRELSKEEYKRLLSAALSNNNKRLYMLMQTICSAGLRVSELKYVTAEAVKKGVAVINCKGKMRVVMLTKELCRRLSAYIKEEKIKKGSVFVSKNGLPLDRSNIWSDMKKLCETAGVAKEKVFPHNLRHLFARTFYQLEKDIVRLADILGHSSINTTRIYTIESGENHMRSLRRLGLLLS